MTLSADEFIRRFLLHTLPDGFHRIRHYGFLANGHRAGSSRSVARCSPYGPKPGNLRRQTGPGYRPAGAPPSAAPCCGGAMVFFAILPRPAPRQPSFWDDSS